MLRLDLAVAVAATLAVPVAAQQEDPFETRLYNVEILTKAVPDRPGVKFGLEYHPHYGPAPQAEEERRLLSPEALINLIRSNIAEDSWSHAQARISFAQGELSVVNRASVHAKIEPYLAYLRSAVARLVSLDAAIVLADPAFLSKLRASVPAERPAILPAEQAKQLFDAAREGKQAELVKSLRVTAHPGQRVHLQEAAKHSYLRDHDVQISTSAGTLCPVMDVFATGAGFDLRAILEPFGGAVTMEVRADASDLEAIESRKLKLGKEMATADGKMISGASGEANVQLPRIGHETLRTTVTVRSGETVLAGALFRKGRVLAFLVTPTVFALDEKPAPEPVFEEQRLLKIYDVSPLTRPVIQFSAPDTDLRRFPGRFDSNDPAGARLSAGEIVDLVRTRVAPETWSNKRNTIRAEEGRLLVVRQKPEVLKEIDRTLASLLQARNQMVTTEAVVVGFRKGARAEWEKEIPALSTGGYFVEEARLEKLLGEAARERRVRLIALGEVTGFPGQRVFAAALREENLVTAYAPQVSTNAAISDPIVSTLHSGFVLDARPWPETGDRVSVALAASVTTREIKEIETTSAGVGPVQTPKVEGPRWDSDAVCAKGKWTLVAVETRGPADDAEDVALFLRARLNTLR